MSNELISASEYEPGNVLVLVDVSYTNSFYAHLKKLGVVCEPPTGAIFNPRVYLDENRRRRTEYTTLVNAIVADGTVKDFEKWIDKWEIPTV
jgi:hypothetical protein